MASATVPPPSGAEGELRLKLAPIEEVEEPCLNCSRMKREHVRVMAQVGVEWICPTALYRPLERKA